MPHMKPVQTRRPARAPVFAFALAALLAALPAPGHAQQPAGARLALAQSGDQILTGAARAQALQRASAALNSVRTMQGRFIQIAPTGQTTTGQFYMQRPGRLRFAYDAPAGMLIVADGTVLAVQDTALRSVNRAPLRTTPLFFVLKNDINLERDAHVARVARGGDTLYVTVRDRTGNADGEITLALSGSNLELRSWDVVDAMGARTRLVLSNVSRPAAIDARLFRAPQSSARSQRGLR